VAQLSELVALTHGAAHLSLHHITHLSYDIYSISVLEQRFPETSTLEF